MHTALWWETENNAVRCGLCPHNCLIAEGRTGICRARKNAGGELVSLVYGNVVSMHVDPVEKKPLYHFHPGSQILSVGVTGCNFRCSFCQNWEISQAEAGSLPTEPLSPRQAASMSGEGGSIGIAYTYNEPLINAEWILDTSRLVRKAGRVNVLVTNGYINPKPMAELMPFIDAANVDVKAFNDDFYKKLCGAQLDPVLRTVEAMHKAGVHVELTTLLIPGKNDSAKEIEKLTAWVASVSADIPLHFSRYHPDYKYTAPATDMESMKRAHDIARKRLKYVYLGNI
jgi:pyruvate formate lyase activating enzyme